MDLTVEELGREVRTNLNMSVHEYFTLLTRNLSRTGKASVIFDKSDGILWVILTPLVYFVLVSLLLTILLLYYWYTDIPADISPIGNRDQSRREPEVIDLPMGLNRTFLNIDGASQVVTRSSSMSKGSVRSLGTLTDLDQSATTRVLNKVFTNSNFSPINFSQRESLEVRPSRKSDRSTVEGNTPEQRFIDPGSGRSMNLSDFQVKYPPPMLADQFKLVWVSGDDVQSDGHYDASYSVVSSGGKRSPFHASGSTNKQTTTRDLNKSRSSYEKTGKRLAMREQLLKYGAKMNKTSCLADSKDQSTLEISAPRNYTDPISRHCARGLTPHSLSSGGSYLDYLRGSEACVPDSEPSDEGDLKQTRRNGRELFNRLSESDDVDVHGVYNKEERLSVSETSLDASCGQMDMSDYQELDYFDICEDQLEEISGDLDLTTPSTRDRATSSMSDVLCADESSENSPPLSLPSSISRFHNSKKGAQDMPQAHYPFVGTQGGADASDDDDETPDGSDTNEVSLYPNEGSCSQTATINTSRLPKPKEDSSSRELYDRLDKVIHEKLRSSLQPEARSSRADSNFSGNTKLRTSSSEPEDETSVNEKKERMKKRKRFSLDILNCGRVTVEDRLTEFGFLKPSGTKYVINPSPGRFFRRGTNQGSGGIDDGEGFSDFDPPSFSDHDSLRQGKPMDTWRSKCSNSFCYGADEPLSLASLGERVFAVKRDAIEDSNNNNLTYIRGGYDSSSTGEAPESLGGGSGAGGASVNQYRDSGYRNHSVNVELSTEGHFVGSSEDRRCMLEKDGWQWKEKPHKDSSLDEQNIQANSNSSSLNGIIVSSQTKPPLPSRLSDASYQKTLGRPVVNGDRNGLSRISDEVNTTIKLQQFRLHRKSTVNLLKVVGGGGGGQSADSNSQDSDFFAKQHPSLMTPPTPDSNGDDRMFTVAADHRYTSTPLYRQ